MGLHPVANMSGLTFAEAIEDQREQAEDAYWAALDATSECYECEKPIVGEPVTDLGDQTHLPKARWRTWCTEDCHVASAEKAEAS